MTTDPIGEIDLAAYVDGELDLERACQVELHLSRQPRQAARVMADLASRSALRLIARQRGAASTDNGSPVSAMSLGGRRRYTTVAMLCIAALGAMIVPNLGSRSIATPPAYLDDAMMSHRITLMRARMVSQPESPHFDAQDLERETHIRVPRLPENWHVLDAQLFPSDEGPALQLLIRTAEGGSLSIFAVRGTSNAPSEPSAVQRGDQSIAYWRKGDISYAVIGDGPPDEIDRIADDLEDNDLA